MRKRNLNVVIKYGVITVAWIFYLIVAMAGSNNDNPEKTPDTMLMETTIQEESSDNVVIESEIENFETEENLQDDVSTEVEKEKSLKKSKKTLAFSLRMRYNNVVVRVWRSW